MWRVLEAAPALVPFAERARLFQLMVAREREVSVRRICRLGAVEGVHRDGPAPVLVPFAQGATLLHFT